MAGYNQQNDETDGAYLRPSVAIPSAAWSRNFWAKSPRRKKPLKPTACQTLPLMPLGFRMWRHLRSVRSTGNDVFMDPFNDWEHDTSHGVPLGGIGCGAMGRGWRGDFRRYSTGAAPSGLVYISDDTPHTGFTICTSSNGETSGCTLLPKPAQSCDVRYLTPDNKAVSYQLYPRAWQVYDTPTKATPTSPQYLATCEQLSPVIAGNYKDSSFPCTAFVWTIDNLSDEALDVAIMFTVHNGTTLMQQQKAGEHTEPISDSACVHMEHKVDGCPGSYCLAADGIIGEYSSAAGAPKAYRCAEWPAESFGSLYNAFVTNKGKLPAKQARQSGPSLGSKGGLGAVSACVTVPAGGSTKLCFSLAWDFPVANFGSSPRKYHLKYTQWYGRDGRASLALAALALREKDTWREKIESWQRPILENEALPEWYKTTLLNETYFLSAGGSLWTADGGLHPGKESEVGHWLYLEGMEYRMHNTYDVHFYASFALTMLFPLLEKSVTQDFADSILLEWLDTRTFLHSGASGVRKVIDCVPHDLGGPTEDPWGKPNIYCIHDTSKWKDLPLKFVLMVYRDYIALGNDIEFLGSMWAPIKKVLAVCCRCFDDGSGMIQNEPWPDQTYDAWKARGVTAYCGGLWLAALRVAERSAELLGKQDDHEHFKRCLVRAQAVYAVLWNSKGYYNYDSSKSSHSDSIMADQCCGEWYIRSCGLPSVLPDGNAKSALKVVYNYNVEKFGQKANQADKGAPYRGAVNGMRPDGSLDTSSMQSMECWTGTTFAVAAHMLMEGLTNEGFNTARGIYEGSYSEFGYWFSTPEAWLGDGAFRSLGYMRPLSVWSIQWAIEQHGLFAEQ